MADFAWYDDREVFHAVPDHAYTTGAVTEVSLVLDIIEKPWHWNDLYLTWVKETADA